MASAAGRVAVFLSSPVRLDDDLLAVSPLHAPDESLLIFFSLPISMLRAFCLGPTNAVAAVFDVEYRDMLIFRRLFSRNYQAYHKLAGPFSAATRSPSAMSSTRRHTMMCASLLSISRERVKLPDMPVSQSLLVGTRRSRSRRAFDRHAREPRARLARLPLSQVLRGLNFKKSHDMGLIAQ